MMPKTLTLDTLNTLNTLKPLKTPGYHESELLRAGVPTDIVVAASNDLSHLRVAGLEPGDVLTDDHVRALQLLVLVLVLLLVLLLLMLLLLYFF